MKKAFDSLWSACRYKYCEGNDIKEGNVDGAWGTYEEKPEERRPLGRTRSRWD
jgi:hypothetical protein